MTAAANPVVTIVISTFNRRDETMRALASCMEQEGVSFEVLVFDDGSTDGTARAIADRFPQVRLCSDGRRRGYIVRRNMGFAQAFGQYVVSLDDDAYFTDPRALQSIVSQFERLPQASAIALRYVEPNRATEGLMGSVSNEAPLRSYVGCAHAIRRDIALEMKGYRELFVHQGEERDLCIRLLDREGQVVLGDNPPIIHAPSPSRERLHLERYGIRNTLLFDVLNVPGPFWVVRAMVDTVRLVARKPGWPITVYRFWYALCAWAACLKFLPQRRPVSPATYRRFQSLPRHGPQPWPANLKGIEIAERNECSSTY